MKKRQVWVRIWLLLALIGLLGGILTHNPSPKSKDYFVLLDVSASVLRAHPQIYQNLHELLRPVIERANPEDQISLAGFAQNMQLWIPACLKAEFQSQLPKKLSQFPQFPPAGATNLGNVLQWALSQVFATRPAEIWIASDGLNNMGNPEAVLLELSRRHIGVFSLLDIPAAPSDFQIRKLTAPQNYVPGIPLQVVVALHGDAQREVNVTLVCKVKTEKEELFSKQLAVHLTQNEIRNLLIPITIEQKYLLQVNVQGQVREQDPFPENNQAEAYLSVAKNLRLGWLGANSALHQTLANHPDITLIDLTADHLNQWLEQLDGLFWQRPNFLHVSRLDQAVHDFVNRGGVLFVAGGVNSFPAADKPGISSLAAHVPLVVACEDQPAQDILILVDRSGSMAGSKFAAAIGAAADLAHSLQKADQLAVGFFADSLPTPKTFKQHGQDFSFAENLFAQEQPHGATDLEKSLEQAAQFFSVHAQHWQKKIFLLSDGKQETATATAQGLAKVAAELASQQIKVFAFAVGEDADLAALDILTQQGKNGRLLQVEDVDHILELFEQNVSKDFYARQLQNVKLHQPNSLSGLPANPPPLQVRTKTNLRAQSELLYATTEGQPVIALRQVGLGRVLGFASPMQAGDAQLWEKNPEVFTSLFFSLRQPTTGSPDTWAIFETPEGKRLAQLRITQSINPEYSGAGRRWLFPIPDFQPKIAAATWFSRPFWILLSFLALFLSFIKRMP